MSDCVGISVVSGCLLLFRFRTPYVSVSSAPHPSREASDFSSIFYCGFSNRHPFTTLSRTPLQTVSLPPRPTSKRQPSPRMVTKAHPQSSRSCCGLWHHQESLFVCWFVCSFVWKHHSLYMYTVWKISPFPESAWRQSTEFWKAEKQHISLSLCCSGAAGPAGSTSVNKVLLSTMKH